MRLIHFSLSFIFHYLTFFVIDWALFLQGDFVIPLLFQFVEYLQDVLTADHCHITSFGISFVFLVSFVPWLGFWGGYIFIHGIILREVNWAWAGISLYFYGLFFLLWGSLFCLYLTLQLLPS